MAGQHVFVLLSIGGTFFGSIGLHGGYIGFRGSKIGGP